MKSGHQIARAGLHAGIAILSCVFAIQSHASEPPDEAPATHGESSSAGAQRLRADLRVLLMDLVQSGAFGQIPADRISLSVDLPAERAADLGVLVDSSSGEAASRGLVVLGTTPGGLAGSLGFRSGDLLLSINDVSLAALGSDSSGGARAVQVLRDTLVSLDDGAALRFNIARDGSTRSIVGKMTSILIPSAHLQLGGTATAATVDATRAEGDKESGKCGRISTFDSAPRQRQLHGATLIDIDGDRSPMPGQTSLRVSAGRHILKVGERIDLRYLGFGQRLRDRGGSERYKTISVDVKPNTTYLLAAQLNEAHRNEWRDGAYWDPVIWSETHENCR